MTLLRKTLDLPYRPQDMFDLVADVGRYPDFIRWIRALRLLEDSETPEGWRGRAEATVGFRNFTETFVTDVVARRPVQDGEAPPVWRIDVSLVRGPFRRLANSWRFSTAPTGSRIEFSIDFVFRNFVLQGLADANRDFAVSRIIGAFTDEAARRYGPRQLNV